MKLVSLSLRNFQGVEQLKIQADGKSVEIRGENKAGKSTVANAACWLLQNKDMRGRAEFDLKPVDENGSRIPELEAEVIGVYSLDDGREVEFKKINKEIWSKIGRSSETKLTGNKNEYYVDGVKKAEGDFNKIVEEIAPKETIRLLTDPLYFAEKLHWTKRRALCVDIAGDVSDSDVIASNSELEDLPGLMGKRNMDDFKAVTLQQRKTVKEELEKIPISMAEAKRKTEDVPDGKPEDAESSVTRCQVAVRDLNKRIAGAESGGEIARLETSITRTEADLLKRKSVLTEEHKNASSKKREKAEKEYRDSVELYNAESAKLDTATRAVDNAEYALDSAKTNHTRLLEEYKSAKASKPPEAGSCVTCGKAQTQEEVDSMIAEFNEKNSLAIQSIIDAGNVAKNAKEEKQAALDKATADVIATEQGVNSSKILYDRAKAALTPTVTMAPDPTTDSDCMRIQDQLAVLNGQLAEERAGAGNNTDALDAELKTAEQELTTAQGLVARYAGHKANLARVKELDDEMTINRAEYEKLERCLYLIEEFIVAKVSLLDDRINSKFNVARFRMFQRQQNGGLKECCDVLKDGVDFTSTLNGGGRVNVGLDCISTLSEHFGISMPVFVDNAESVTTWEVLPRQIIKLIADVDYDELTVIHE